MQPQHRLIHVPRDLPFTKSILDCVNFAGILDGCPADNLVAVERALTEAKKHVDDLAPKRGSPSGRVRIPPLAFSRLARGGKTTLLMQLFGRLKKDEKYAPIIININGNFLTRAGESHQDAVMRLIATQLVDVSEKDAQNIVCDETALLKHIDQTSQGKSVVLLIDELNRFGVPIDGPLSVFLKAEFLDRANRYLVFTTHVPMSVDAAAGDEEKQPQQPEGKKQFELMTSGGSGRLFKTVHMPQSDDLALLQRMSDACAALTPCELALYGGIPSLIYTFKSGEDPEARFEMEKKRGLVSIEEMGDAKPSVLKSFIRSVLSGRVDESRFLRFGSIEPKTGLMQFPLFYIACVAKLFFNVSGCEAFADWILKQLPVFATMTEKGLEWELTVRSAVLLRCIDARINGTDGPFSIVPTGSCPVVKYHTLDSNCKTLDGARRVVLTAIASCASPTLLLFTPSFGLFPQFDGIVCFTPGTSSKSSKSSKSRRIVAYQCKKGNGTVDVDNAVPKWIERAYLLRGEAPETSPGPRNKPKWKYMDEKEMKDLLGHSLSFVYPKDWTE